HSARASQLRSPRRAGLCDRHGYDEGPEPLGSAPFSFDLLSSRLELVSKVDVEGDFEREAREVEHGRLAIHVEQDAVRVALLVVERETIRPRVRVVEAADEGITARQHEVKPALDIKSRSFAARALERVDVRVGGVELGAHSTVRLDDVHESASHERTPSDV